MMERARFHGPAIVAYDRGRATELLRDSTASLLRSALRSGEFEGRLNAAAMGELDELLMDWEQRALGPMPLRDALLVDSQRGQRVYNLICQALTRERLVVPAPLAIHLPTAPVELPMLPTALAAEPELQALLRRAQTSGLALAWQARPDSFPLPADLDRLVADPPQPYPRQGFEQPRGLRRRLSVALAGSGATLLAFPLLLGQIPDHPAGLPLALITLALLIGIRAGLAGFCGSACIWLVANLPEFRHGTTLSHVLWPALPLLVAGVLLLSADERIRAMWAWIRGQFGGET